MVGPERLSTLHAALGRAYFSSGAPDRDSLQRSAFHYRAAGRPEEVDRVTLVWLRISRRNGDGRGTGDLVRDLVGEAEGTEAADAILRRVPAGARLRFSRYRKAGLAAVAVFLVLGATAVVALGGREARRPDARLLVGFPGQNTRVVDLTYGNRDAGRTISPLENPEWNGGSVPWNIAFPALHPTQPLWAYARTVPDSGGEEVFILHSDGREARLTNQPGDDINPSWSPDGRFLVFSTGRWNPEGWADLAIMDVRTRSLRPITKGDGYDIAPHWSPDGSRIAFLRDYRTEGAVSGAQVCWITFDGSSSECRRAPPGTDYYDIVGWQGADRLLVSGKALEGFALMRLELSSGLTSIIRRDATSPLSSPDGSWISCFCRLTGESSYAWYVFPSDHPDVGTRLETGELSPAELQLMWGPMPSGPPYVQRVVIGAPESAIPVDGSYVLHAHGVTPEGDDIGLPLLRWSSLDTMVARVRPETGAVLPGKEGEVTLIASAGGWRSDTVTVTIGPPASVAVERQDWGMRWQETWRTFGEPAPSIVREGGKNFFWNRGDSTYENGIYSLKAWSAREGLGLEAEVVVPLTRTHWQHTAVGVAGWMDTTQLAIWDHRTGAIPHNAVSLRQARECLVGFPAGEGVRPQFSAVASAAGLLHEVPVDSAFRTGIPFTVRIQIFPDRRCGVAIDGIARWISPAPLAVDREYRAMISGKSFHTKVLVGAITIWTGVRRDVDWEAVDQQ